MTVVEKVVSDAIRLGADAVAVEHKDGYAQVFAVKGGVGCGIARFESSSLQAASLRTELGAPKRQRRRRPAQFRKRQVCDKRIARCAPDAFADPIHEARAEHRCHRGGEREDRLRDRTESVAEHHEELPPPEVV
jgi:hypothetical protein